MPKIPRDISGSELSKLLSKYGYKVVRQTGSHIRLVSKYQEAEHKLTLPNHNPIKIGTLNNILNDVSDYLKIPKQILISQLFKK